MANNSLSAYVQARMLEDPTMQYGQKGTWKENIEAKNALLPYYKQFTFNADGSVSSPQMFATRNDAVGVPGTHGSSPATKPIYAYDPGFKYTPPTVNGVAQANPYTVANWLSNYRPGVTVDPVELTRPNLVTGGMPSFVTRSNNTPDVQSRGFAMPKGNALRTVLDWANTRGRDGDTSIVHVNPLEKSLLKAFGGKGTINPETGLEEFAPAEPSNFDQFVEMLKGGYGKYDPYSTENLRVRSSGVGEENLGNPAPGTVVSIEPGVDITKFMDTKTGIFKTVPATSIKSITKDNIAAVVALDTGTPVIGPSYRVIYKDGTHGDVLPGYLEDGYIGAVQDTAGEKGGDTYVKADGSTFNEPIYDARSTNFFGKIAQGVGDVVAQNPFIVPLAFAGVAAAAEGLIPGLSLGSGTSAAETGASVGLEEAISGVPTGLTSSAELGAAALENASALEIADALNAYQLSTTGVNGTLTVAEVAALTKSGVDLTKFIPGMKPEDLLPYLPGGKELLNKVVDKGVDKAIDTGTNKIVDKVVDKGTDWSSKLVDYLGASFLPALSGILNYKAAGDASDAQVNALNAATAENKRQFDLSREDLAPWRTAGVNALGTLVSKVNAGPGTFTESPGYQFRLGEGQKTIERSAAAKGNVLGGAALKGLTRYGQDYASNEYQNWLNQYYQSLTPYQSLAGIGQTATNTQVGLNQNQAALNSQNALATGNANAAGIINQTNAITGAVNNGYNNYLMWKYLNK